MESNYKTEELLKEAWEEAAVFGDWKIVPGKETLTHCDNWQGISLLEKVFALVLQEKLQVIAEAQIHSLVLDREGAVQIYSTSACREELRT